VALSAARWSSQSLTHRRSHKENGFAFSQNLNSKVKTDNRYLFSMGEAGNSLIKGIDIQEIIETLDSFHAQSWLVVHFSFALKNRLEGQAAFLFSKDLDEKADQSMKHAKKLAQRITELGGTETADPTRFVDVAKLGRFSMPSSMSDIEVILSHVLELEQSIIRKYGEFMTKIRDKDDLTYHLIRDILEDEVKDESEIETNLAASKKPEMV
jgi:bacterioferritin